MKYPTLSKNPTTVDAYHQPSLADKVRASLFPSKPLDTTDYIMGEFIQPLHYYKDVANEKKIQGILFDRTFYGEYTSDKIEDDVISLALEEKVSLYALWKYLVIIKLFGGKLNNHFIKSKINEL